MSECGTSSPTILVIGYGNELRGDDGIGPRVAEAVAAANPPDVWVRRVLQLAPELAAEIAGARLVIFVDALAGTGSGALKLAPIAAEGGADWNTHAVGPLALLALTRAVYDRTPEAWLLTVPGQNFDPGEGLSSAAEEGVRQATACISRLIQART